MEKKKKKWGKCVFVSWWTELIFAFQVRRFSEIQAQEFIYARCQIDFKHLACQTNKQCNKSSLFVLLQGFTAAAVLCGQAVWSSGTFITHMSTTCTKFNGPAVNSRANSLHFHWQNGKPIFLFFFFFFLRRLFFHPATRYTPRYYYHFSLNPTVPMCRERNGVMFN